MAQKENYSILITITPANAPPWHTRCSWSDHQGVVQGSSLSGAAAVVAAPDAKIHWGNENYANDCH
jgi:hypothetical protein